MEQPIKIKDTIVEFQHLGHESPIILLSKISGFIPDFKNLTIQIILHSGFTVFIPAPATLFDDLHSSLLLLLKGYNIGLTESDYNPNLDDSKTSS